MRPLRLTITCLAAVIVATLATRQAVRWLRPEPARQIDALEEASAPIELPNGHWCEARRQAAAAASAMPGAPALSKVRAELVARAKAEPVLFLDTPKTAPLEPELLSLRTRLFQDGVPWQALNEVFSKLKRQPKRLRQVVLTDGYLYAEKPDLAALLSSGISLNQLFTEPEVIVTRGAETRRARSKNGEYVWSDGAEQGQLARLWLFDRVSLPGDTLEPPKHLAIGDLRTKLGATRIEIERLTSSAVLVRLVYGDTAVPALLSNQSGHLELECEVISAEQRSVVEAARSRNQKRERVLSRLRAAIAEQVEEGLPFDEPKTEEGQQDGKLRQEWKEAYKNGFTTFEFNGDKYEVFGRGGVPRTPQVCVDFITDTWERMSGTRWAKRDEPRARQVGRLDFDQVNIQNRRSVENLIDFAVGHPEWFELLLIPETERVPFADRGAFFRRLFDLRSDFQPGDVVAILGKRDDEKLHYHSFFIVADDPLTSMPTLLAANAGRPRIRTWEGEMQNAPRRSIMARIRPRLDWLEAVAGINAPEASSIAAK